MNTAIIAVADNEFGMAQENKPGSNPLQPVRNHRADSRGLRKGRYYFAFWFMVVMNSIRYRPPVWLILLGLLLMPELLP